MNNPIELAFNRAEDYRNELIKSLSPKQMHLIEVASSYINDGHNMLCDAAQSFDGYEENSAELRLLNEGVKILDLYGLTTDQQECF